MKVEDLAFSTTVVEGLQRLFGKFDIIEAEFGAMPDTAVAFNHRLGKVPTGWIVIYQDQAGSVYDGQTAPSDVNDDQVIWLKSDTASMKAKVFVF